MLAHNIATGFELFMMARNAHIHSLMFQTGVGGKAIYPGAYRITLIVSSMLTPVQCFTPLGWIYQTQRDFQFAQTHSCVHGNHRNLCIGPDVRPTIMPGCSLFWIVILVVVLYGLRGAFLIPNLFGLALVVITCASIIVPYEPVPLNAGIAPFIVRFIIHRAYSLITYPPFLLSPQFRHHLLFGFGFIIIALRWFFGFYLLVYLLVYHCVLSSFGFVCQSAFAVSYLSPSAGWRTAGNSSSRQGLGLVCCSGSWLISGSEILYLISGIFF